MVMTRPPGARTIQEILADARQRLVISPIYITPILHGSAWYSPKNLLLSGWEISGITTLATGFPFDISYGGFGVSNALIVRVFQMARPVPNALKK